LLALGEFLLPVLACPAGGGPFAVEVVVALALVGRAGERTVKAFPDRDAFGSLQEHVERLVVPVLDAGVLALRTGEFMPVAGMAQVDADVGEVADRVEVAWHQNGQSSQRLSGSPVFGT
jgi:hypothetical protein